MTQTVVLPSMTDQQRALFETNYRAAAKDELAGVLLAFFLGGFGAHHFYLRRNGLGVLYLCFFWTGITYLIGWIECFFMPGRVRNFNAELAMALSSAILAGAPMPFAPLPLQAPPVTCPGCGAAQPAQTSFCARCGAPLASRP
ncbi:MAG: NINE protein [Acidobacteriaceae bacterium]